MKSIDPLKHQKAGRPADRMMPRTEDVVSSPDGGIRNGLAPFVFLTLALVLCACSKDDAKLWRIGIPYSNSVWVDYIFDEADPEKPVLIVNPYADQIRGKQGGGIRGDVVYSTWTTEVGGTEHGWQVKLRADPPVFQIVNKTGSLANGRFIVLSDSKVGLSPKQIDLSIPGGMKSEAEIRKWLDGIGKAAVLGLSRVTTGSAKANAGKADLDAHLAAERAMMTRILGNEMHGFTGITEDPKDTIAYHGLHSYQSGDSYVDRAFIPWDGKNGYIVFEVQTDNSPFKYYGIAIGEDGKAHAMGASKIIPSEKPKAAVKIKNPTEP